MMINCKTKKRPELKALGRLKLQNNTGTKVQNEVEFEIGDCLSFKHCAYNMQMLSKH